ncbi:DUF2076 domain-containing protein [Devosia sp.]|uniref:DUF2076 domain-containing protein n=1 Tax=Devosia sp. TaxID=1871048 RepID=UPI0025BD016C|nr:DUF2076 domain-containing protein [Devosia sp.]
MIRDEDERAIDDLFERLHNVERNSAPRDNDAERLIRQRLSENPASAYYMAQTIIVQEAALREAQQRIEALEARQGQGGFLGGIFGTDRPSQPAQPAPERRGPWGRGNEDYERRQPSGGGFLAGAAQTALGVTGGLLLGSAIAGMFAGGAQASEPDMSAQPEADDPGMDDGGGDWGDFDIGGDF